jgi:serine/threonine protein phosphatase PrpC
LKLWNKKKELENLRKAMRERKFCEDAPEDSDLYQLRVREGDLLILGTDGVFDNLFEEEILLIIRTITVDSPKTKMTAQVLS